MAASYDGQLVQTTIAGTDYSSYLDELTIPYKPDMTKATTWATGGAPIAEKSVQGAISEELGMRAPFSKTFLLAMQPYFGSRTGAAIVISGGSNALPTTGDEKATITASILELDWNYETGSRSDTQFKWMIPDGTSTAPSLTTV